VRQTISRIDTLRIKVDALSGEITRSLDASAARIVELENQANSLEKQQ